MKLIVDAVTELCCLFNGYVVGGAIYVSAIAFGLAGVLIPLLLTPLFFVIAIANGDAEGPASEIFIDEMYDTFGACWAFYWRGIGPVCVPVGTWVMYLFREWWMVSWPLLFIYGAGSVRAIIK